LPQNRGMTVLLGISGSLRQAPFNTALLRAAATLLPADTSLQICTLHGIPLYDGDLEAVGLPERIRKFVAGFVDAVRRSQR
jgi:chromate reductase, NAD(P)H dehydrogenase (quinone)